MRVLIIGGYGNFGFRLAKLLANQAQLHITLAGRNLDKAKLACSDLAKAAATFQPARLDRSQNLSMQIEIPPDIIVDTSGPFQIYGDDPYNVVDYVLKNGCHYLDIADSAAFVSGISKYNSQAKTADITVLSGLSTYPCLTSAVFLAFKKQFDAVTCVRAGIAPSPKGGLGKNVIKAITAYAGKPIPAYRNTQTAKTHGLTEGFKYRIYPPGIDPLDWRLFSNVEAPETLLWPKSFTEITDIWLGAGPKPMFLHRCLMGMSCLVKWKLLPGLTGLSSIMASGLGIFTQGAHRGGMFVELSGTRDNHPQTLTWHLIAEGDDGPNIPIIPVAIMISKILADKRPPSGARASVGAVTLEEYERLFARFQISTGTWNSSDQFDNLYEQSMGTSFQKLPGPLRELHTIKKRSVFQGRAKVTRGKSSVAWITGLVFRFPKTTEDTPVKVVLSNKNGVETWERFFGDRRMVSLQELGTGSWKGLIVEKFGPVSIAMAPIVKNGQMHLVTKGWSIFGCPLPRWLAPGGEIFEHDTNGRFNFHVDICAPLLGRLVKYEGWLKPIKE